MFEPAAVVTVDAILSAKPQALAVMQYMIYLRVA